MISRAFQPKHDRSLAIWLFSCAVIIFAMIILGGVTRLTESGLSMVEWRPIMGIWPPIGEAAWLEVFAKYQQFPEFQILNKQMSLDEFKVIFMYEYLHRVLGRVIGLAFFLPLLFFSVRGIIRPGLMPKLLALLILGGCQGLLGWYMVQSGLVDRPSVSQYRLTAHLGLAVALYAAIVWQGLSLWRGASTNVDNAAVAPTRDDERNGGARWHGTVAIALTVLVYLMILSGGLVAGTDAGFFYPTWPLMGDSFVPSGLYQSSPAWMAAFEDVITIQFNHRMFAYFLVATVGAFALALLISPPFGRARWFGGAILVALSLQISLGISTLLTHVAVPVAAAHQGGAIVLLTTLLVTASKLRLPLALEKSHGDSRMAASGIPKGRGATDASVLTSPVAS